MEQFYKFNELTNYPMIIGQLNLSLIVTALIGVEFSQVCPHRLVQVSVKCKVVGIFGEKLVNIHFYII